MRHISIQCEFSRIFDWSSRIYDWSSTVDLNAAFYMCRIEFIIMLNKLCLLEWELTRRSRSAILFGKKMRRLNQISRTYSFESTKISIWFGACKMRRLNRALILFSKFFKNLHNFNNSTFLEVWYVFGDKSIKYHKSILNAIKLLTAQEYIN